MPGISSAEPSDVMIKDGIYKVLCLPFLALSLAWLSGLFCCYSPGAVEIASTLLFFAFLLLIIWQLTAFIVSRLRIQSWLQHALPLKLFTISGASAINGFLWASAGAWLWQRFNIQGFNLRSIMVCGLSASFISVGIGLLYEALFLAKEQQLSVKIVTQLDHERMQAELAALKAELDPHFMFNSLTTLLHLTGSNPHTAQVFTQKLAQVYKYFLINKERELISLHEELKFIEDYFYLLQIRYDNAVQLQLHTDESLNGAMILPVSLQLLVENAIKHNHFSERHPLIIHISTSPAAVTIANELRSKSYAVESTRVGLSHLRHHYKLLCNKDIVIESSEGQFSVTIPLIKNEMP